MIKEMIQKGITSIRDLPPASFALIMATGIVAITAFIMHLYFVSWTLFYISCIAYVVLWFLFLMRIVFFGKHVLKDFSNALLSPGFFTIIAATTVLGREITLLTNNLTLALWLWFVSLFLWIIFSYLFFTQAIIMKEKTRLDKDFSGVWLLTVVATQGVSLLGARLVTRIPSFAEPLLFFTLILYMLGCLLYIMLIFLIFYRLLFLKISGEDLSPSYWITMGAGAITTLAGATLIANSQHVIFLHTILPFLIGFTLLFWASATWWIPLLVIFGIWRHIYHRIPYKDGIQYWCIVFPLGMYAVATHELAIAMHVHFLLLAPAVLGYIALIAWLLVGTLRTYTFFVNILKH